MNEKGRCVFHSYEEMQKEAKIMTLSLVALLPCKVHFHQWQNMNRAIDLPVLRLFSISYVHCTQQTLHLMNYYSHLMNTGISILDSEIRLVQSCTNDMMGAGPTFPFPPFGALQVGPAGGLKFTLSNCILLVNILLPI